MDYQAEIIKLCHIIASVGGLPTGAFSLKNALEHSLRESVDIIEELLSEKVYTNLQGSVWVRWEKEEPANPNLVYAESSDGHVLSEYDWIDCSEDAQIEYIRAKDLLFRMRTRMQEKKRKRNYKDL